LKICREKLDLVKVIQTRIHKKVLVLPATLNRHIKAFAASEMVSGC